MPRPAIKDNGRMSLRIRPEDKALLMRAVAYEHTDLTDFVMRNAMQAAKAVIARAERVLLSERDGLRVLDALENPPHPNAKLLAAAQALPSSAITIPLWHEEPIARRPNREAFDRGDAAFNDFLHRHARQTHDRGGAKTFLAVGE